MLKKNIQIKHNDGFYFPLFNLKGLYSSITPYWGGDLKSDHHHYALQPTSELSLYEHTMSRNLFVEVNQKPYLMNGQRDYQQDDHIDIEAGLLYHKITRHSKEITFEVTSFIPTDDTVELHEIILTNPTGQKKTFKVTTAIPLYARSADNVRDHRHVTSLLSRVETTNLGIINQPTLSFDERGHKTNEHVYSVFAQSQDVNIKGFIPTMHDFIRGGSLIYPRGLDQLYPSDYHVDGYEAMGAIQFDELVLQPGESLNLYLSIGIHESKGDAHRSQKYLNKEAFHQALEDVKQFFGSYSKGLSFKMVDEEVSDALSWVVLQPLLRRYFGNSYLPHHDYGRGGKGWRDLWQDLLALIIMNDDSVKELLYNNFLGVRLDGSNATIIGNKPGEFKADRNMITRVWSDHGAWPLLTVHMYLDETGDLDFLLKKQGYFQDQFTHYTKKTRAYESPVVLNGQKEPYQGTILEHLLLTNLVGHHNIGEHGFVKLEDADWNDGLDMAHHLGETIAFTHMYADNLRKLAHMIEELHVDEIEVFHELAMLFNKDINLNAYFDRILHFTGEKIRLDAKEVTQKLYLLASERIDYLQNQAFINESYQSYFNNLGCDPDAGDHLNLTGQAIALLSQTPTEEQAIKMADYTKKMLFEPSVGGYHLNTDYGRVLTEMGRAYGFAYGHKENGAVFSHMVMMYAYGLYQYHLIDEGREAWFTLLKQALNPESKVFVGIPEYFTDRGIGMYPYLTGSASWMLKLIRTEVFGIHMKFGKVFLEPKLTKDDFIDGVASVTTYLFGKLVTITYINKKQLDAHAYSVKSILMSGNHVQNGFSNVSSNIEVILDEVC
ncbi:MAG: hypothetical protein RBQ71_07520 [Acholeplasmataceae bacterium]|jgi:cellobiose phosphorylase|nr:hypothetical protein [Acholeplasmataceae bacterium]